MNTLKTYIQEADAVERTAGRIRRTLIMARVTLVGSDRISDSLTSSLPHFYPLLLSPGSPLPPSLPPSPSSLTLACTHLETSTSPPLRLSLQNSSHFSSKKYELLFRLCLFSKQSVCCRMLPVWCRLKHWPPRPVAPPPSGPLSPYAGPVFVF